MAGAAQRDCTRLKRVAMMFNPETAPQSDYYLRPLESAARSLGVEPIVARVRNDSEIEESVTAFGREPGGGLIVMPDFSLRHIASRSYRKLLAIELPAIYPFRFFAAIAALSPMAST